jgi:hypothetical protein
MDIATDLVRLVVITLAVSTIVAAVAIVFGA